VTGAKMYLSNEGPAEFFGNMNREHGKDVQHGD